VEELRLATVKQLAIKMANIRTERIEKEKEVEALRK